MGHRRYMMGMLLAVASCGPEAQEEPEAVGRCVYVNGFTQLQECKEYLGSNWAGAVATDDCAEPVPDTPAGQFEPGVLCDRSAVLAECQVEPGTVEAYTIVFWDQDGATCDGLELGCFFAQGTYVGSTICP